MLSAAIFCVSAFIAPSAAVEFDEMLVIGSLGTGGRVPITTDAMRARLVAGEEINPSEGDTMLHANGTERTWKNITVAEDGWFSDRAFRGGYGYVSFTSDEEKVMMLEASGHAFAYVNGKPRGGDPYAFGYSRYPVLVKKGLNELLFKVSRGRVRAKLVDVNSEVFLETRDTTLPDFMIDETGVVYGAVILTNATTEDWAQLSISAQVNGGSDISTDVGSIPALMSRKVPFKIQVPRFTGTGTARLRLSLVLRPNPTAVSSTLEFDVTIRASHDQHKRTFVSKVDGSVQYYAVKPPFKNSLDTADGLILTVHGAGVEATGQAAAYGSKSWAHIVAPTNRRPYGFDWEDWGRIDAMEVLADAKRIYQPREDRIYLTGHSMGGHGAWYLGATYPDQWGAIGPAAGWISFWTYGGAVRFENPDPIEAMMLRVSSPSDLTKIIRNFMHHGVFVLHGAEDNTVPISQPRQMRKYLSEFHRDVDWYEHPGGGHWYDSSPEPGADCVDYGPMFDFFDRRRRRLSNESRRVEFHTTHPGVSATSHWVTVVAQETPFVPSFVVATNPIGTNRFEILTENINRLSLSLEDSPIPNKGETVDVVIDDIEIKAVMPTDSKVYLQKSGSAWRAVQEFPSADKKPERAGPFKAAFDNGFVLVYGTTGTQEENEWSFAKARYDAETWWYRGNGHVTIVADYAYDPKNYRGSNVIAYGNEDSNAALKLLLADSALSVTRSAIRVDKKNMVGNDLSIMAILPIGDGNNSLGVVGGTGISGMRSTDTMPYFVSGVHYPDVFVFNSQIHKIGSKAVQVAGVFGTDWSVTNGNFAWRD